MFIREVKTKNSKTGEIYTKHVLVESVRADGKPRQRTIMILGHLDLPRLEWKKLAHALECQLSGQISLLEGDDKDIDKLALSLISNNKLSQKLKQIKNESSRSEKDAGIPIILDSITTEATRSLGPELVCQDTWNLLKFDRILKSCGFSRKHTAVAKALIFGRLISPGSERHIFKWFKKRSSLTEFPGCDISNIGKDLFYEINDRLYNNKEKIEEMLFHNQQELFPSTGNKVYLYDLTNTYMEGSSLGNELAARGHCKSKRKDCPLLALSLLVDNNGSPITSHIYKGNQSEPETMKSMLDRLHTLSGYAVEQMVLVRPTLIMDRGIATKDNITLLRSQGYQYIVVSREDHSDEYIKEFKTARETFTRIDDLSHKHTAYGDESHVYVKKISLEGENTCRILCMSDGKSKKETAIVAKKDKRFTDDVEKLNSSIKNGYIKNSDKIKAKIDRIKKRHRAASEKYNALILYNSEDKAIGAEATPISSEQDPLAGCYVIESTHTELNAVETWKLYMTQVKVEAAFRSMKGELGMRPVFHQKADRSSAHLFITVLAYHILSAIQRRLAKKDDTRQWQTIREVLSTHTRSTVVMKDNDGNIYHKRVSGKPEDIHSDIYNKLDIMDVTKPIVSSFK
jgi:hypothetical protein